MSRHQSQRTKPKGKGLNPFTSSSANQSYKSSDANNQISKSLLQLAKNKSKDGKDKEKKKKKGKGGSAQTAGTHWRQHFVLFFSNATTGITDSSKIYC